MESEHSTLSILHLTSRKLRYGELNNAFLNSLDWTEEFASSSIDYNSYINKVILPQLNPSYNTIEYFDPMWLNMKANQEDVPSWHEATMGPYKDGFWEAMETELNTLERIEAWSVVDRTKEMNVLDSVWAFKIKRYPDGSLRKLKARFCVKGFQQIEGVDYFETYSPVVAWSTVRLIFTIALILNLQSVQVDYTAAFPQAPLTEDVYVEMPRGFKKSNQVYKLKRNLYGLKQAARNFFEHLKEKLESQNFRQSNLDQCLFIHKNILVLIYVDDCIFFSKDKENITNMIKALRESGLEIEPEHDMAGFLGVLIDRNNEKGHYTLTQVGLIERIITSLELNGAKGKKTPAEHGALPADKDGEACNESFNYSSIVGMMSYLSGHTRPELEFAVHQCGRYSHNPRAIHEAALKRIGRYLVNTRDKGIILTPTSDLKIDCFVDADFAGLWSYENPNDPVCVRSRTGYVIMFCGVPIIWKSKLQTEITLSTMEAEYVALSMAMKELLPVRELIIEVCESVGLSRNDLTSIHSTVWEDNAGCAILANMELPRMTPRSKHYAVKYHWFRSKLKPNNIKVEKIDGTFQLADIFTKALRTDKFERLRKLLMGW